MDNLEVVVYAICKNEAQFVDRWMDSMSEADAVYVVDTGSSDDTVAMLKERGAHVYLGEVTPWRFDTARNLSLAHVPSGAKICVCTDLDEEFEPGWREKLVKAWDEAGDYPKKQAHYTYNWSLKEDGSPGSQFTYGKIHSRQGFKWSYPCHEWLSDDGGGEALQVEVPHIILNHKPDAKKNRKGYLDLLEQGVREFPHDPRMRYYLGREYMFSFRHQDAIDTLKAYLGLVGAVWEEERCAAMRYIGTSFLYLNQDQEAAIWYTRAIAEAPGLRDAYVDYARLAYKQQNWPLQYFLLESALGIKKRSPTFVNSDYAWDETPYDLQSIAAYRLGKYRRSLECAALALAFNPTSPRLLENFKKIQDAVPGGGVS